MSKPNKSSRLSGFQAKKSNVAKNLNALDPIKVAEVSQRNKEKMVFSFKLFDKSHEAFNLGGVESKWYPKLFEAMAEWSKHTWVELNQKYRHIYDPHKYNDKKANVKNVGEYIDLEQHDLYQIRLNQSDG